LAVTDANLLLGRLIPEYFPKIFGKSENEPLDVDASLREFEKLAQNINESSASELSLDEIIYGCVRNVTRSIRNPTSERG
jgi:5-oxoprolinase (ATP-hydrolysing)